MKNLKSHLWADLELNISMTNQFQQGSQLNILVSTQQSSLFDIFPTFTLQYVKDTSYLIQMASNHSWVSLQLISETCIIWKKETELIDHLLLNYVFSSGIWSYFLNRCGLAWYVSNALCEEERGCLSLSDPDS